jgi:hypothetical protein
MCHFAPCGDFAVTDRSTSIASQLPRVLLGALGLALSCGASAGTFVYDGRLDDGGRPAQGQYDILLTPWSQADKGQTLSAPIRFHAVAVNNGQFRIEFEAPLDASDQAWLEVAVRDAGASGAFNAIPGRVKAQNLIGQCWSVTGDSGSNPLSNFLGTLDNQPLVLRSNNLRVASLQANGTASSYGDAPSIAMGSGANVASAVGATVSGGGATRTELGTLDATLRNSATGSFSTISGGTGNSASSNSSTVSGGGSNSAAGVRSTVSGGITNTATGANSSVGGGSFNVASNTSSTVSGGNSNTASGVASTVSGGNSNIASGVSSTASGGSFNCAGGDFSWVGGRRARTRPGNEAGDGTCTANSGDSDGDNGTFVWADATGVDFTSTGPNQFLTLASGGVGFNTPSIPAHADLVVAQRGTAIANVDLLLRTSGRNDAINIAMSPDVGGAALFVAQYNGTTFTNRLVLEGDGDLVVSANAFKPGGGSWAASSDARLKSDVEPMHGVLARLLSLRGVTFRYTDPDPAKRPAGTHDGLIAQEVAKVFPSWVQTDSEGFFTVGSQGFEALTVEALRELRAEKDVEIKALAQENAELRARLERIEHALGASLLRGER